MIIKLGQSAIVFSGPRLTVVNREDFKVSQFVHKIFGDWSRKLILGKLTEYMEENKVRNIS